MEKNVNDLGQAPDIEEALRNPVNEHAYRNNYNRLLTERVILAIKDTLKDNPKKEEKEKELRSLLEGNNGSTTLEGNMVKALSEAGLLRIASITSRGDIDSKGGWFEKKRMTEWEKDLGHELWGVVEKYWVELPGSEAQPPVTTNLLLEAKQQKIENAKNIYGGDLWGDIDYNKWTLARISY